jgi:hypothetical protein
MVCLESGLHLHQLGMLFLNAGADVTLQDVSYFDNTAPFDVWLGGSGTRTGFSFCSPV